MNKKADSKFKKDDFNAGIILSSGGIIISILGMMLIIIEGVQIGIITIIGGVIITSLGLILSELESQTDLFIAYVEDFVKPHK